MDQKGRMTVKEGELRAYTVEWRNEQTFAKRASRVCSWECRSEMNRMNNYVSQRRISYKSVYFTRRASQSVHFIGRRISQSACILWAHVSRGRAFQGGSLSWACISRACLMGLHPTDLHLIGAYISQNVHLRCVYLMDVALSRAYIS
jgi:hypothetical protein